MIKSLKTFDLKDKRVLIRVDFNVPIENDRVVDDFRIKATIPTIQYCLKAGANIVLMSHLGRPNGQVDSELSLIPTGETLADLLEMPIKFSGDCISEDAHDVSLSLRGGEIHLLENLRFHSEETNNDSIFSAQLAKHGQVYINDAFGTAHRAQASTHGVAKFAATACAGPLLSGELDALGKALDNPARPLVAIVGGSKVSTKLTVLDSLAGIVDQLVVGGGIANTFIAADGHNVGKSLFEADLVEEATRLTKQAQVNNGSIPVPTDVVVATEFSASASATLKPVNEVTADEMIFDIGPDTAKALTEIIANAGTIVWNGPVGVFEFDQFGEGTKVIAQAIADSSAFSIAGGGDTLAAVDKYEIADKISYISTGGGAFLEFLEGKKLPAVEILEQRAK